MAKLSGPVLVVAGARPNFMKVVPILHELDRRGIPRVFVHTGQHYDVKMSSSLLEDLGSPVPDVSLEVGSGSHAVQTARVMERFDPLMEQYDPSWVVVVGDVNSTLAAALVVSKNRGRGGAKLAHVEAGLRSYSRSMPEEVNRVLTDAVSDLLLLPSRDAFPNLDREGHSRERAVFVGNVMIDSLLAVLPAARSIGIRSSVGIGDSPFVLATLHRPSNVDDPIMLGSILNALVSLSGEYRVVLPLHPRTRRMAEQFKMSELLEHCLVLDPLRYSEMVALLDEAAVVITDSGGLQEESCVLGVRCITVREQTERPITIAQGTNELVSWPPSPADIAERARRAAARGRLPVGSASPEGWDGKAAMRIVGSILESSK